jgi:hypothetical protein
VAEAVLSLAVTAERQGKMVFSRAVAVAQMMG